ncbi:MAG TPA: hypothetical protein VN784_11165 [Candidatus Limnocylindrales bacterium]|nr:hypothetical protein [Candidatus Limnocylindrales bacterium]
MNAIIAKLLNRACGLANVEPVIALFVGAALLAVFLTALFQTKNSAEPGGSPGLLWTLYHNFTRLFWGLALVVLLMGTISILRSYLRQAVNDFSRSHGRITQANYNAVQTIWGSEQVQGELNVDIYHNEELTERIESEDPSKPALLRKKIQHVSVTGNPFVSARHEITLRQNARKKGSAFYGGYETDCGFNWQLRNPAASNQLCTLTFPLPASDAMYDGLVATLDGRDVLPQMEIKDSSLVLKRDVQPDEVMNFHIAFKSRGLSYWYFQVREAREIRDFTLVLNLPDLPKSKLNYPDGCMTPTDIAPTKDHQGTILTYRLDHALNDKGMGISLPQLPQPGETTRAVLGEVGDAWLLVFGVLALSLTLVGARHAVLLTVLVSTATALGYGLLADFCDLLLGFWGTAMLVLVPYFLLLAKLLIRASPRIGQWLAAQLLLLGIVYPCLAGLDADRQSLYLNLCALAFLSFAAWLLVKNVMKERIPRPEAVVVNPTV